MKKLFLIGCTCLGLIFGSRTVYAEEASIAETQMEEAEEFALEIVQTETEESVPETTQAETMESLLETTSKETTEILVEDTQESEREEDVREYVVNEVENAMTKSIAAEENPAEDFVCRLYRQVLGREPDEAGLKDWVNYLLSGEKTGVEVADGFIYSTELADRNLENSGYVEMLYGSFLNRSSDNEGRECWTTYLDKGMSRTYVYSGFANSDEFQNLCNQYGISGGKVVLTAPRDQNEDITMFVYRCYNKFLERKPDEEGLNDWCGRLLVNRINGKETARGFIMSNEFQEKDISNEDYIKTLYLGLFDRNADTEGLKCWVDILSAGTSKEVSREEVFRGFSDSNEFVDMCERYGIVPGKGGNIVNGIWVPDVHKMISDYNYTAGVDRKVQYLVIHYVGALNDAIENCEFFAEGNQGRSAHYFVNYNGEIYQSVEDENIAWHCGSSHYVHDECRNENSIGIEMCVRKRNTEDLNAYDRDWYFEDETVDSVVHLVRYLMEKYNIPITNVIRHYDVSGKICPNPYVFNSTNHTWQEFLERLAN